MKDFCWVLLAVALLPGCASGASVPSGVSGTTKDQPHAASKGDGVKFEYKPKLGQTTVYDIKIAGGTAAHPFHTTQTRTVTVTDAGSGNYRVETTLEGPMTPKTVVVEVLSPKRAVLSTLVNGKTVGAYDGGASPRDMMPDRPVVIGSNWNAKQTVAGKTIESQYKLEKVETVNGVEVATVDIVKISINGGKIIDTGEFVMETANGNVHSWTLHQTIHVNGGTATTDITMVRRP
ncbi:MAG: hypothetical protein ACYC96_11975 [Fimbriimonadaceae bacterium]